MRNGPRGWFCFGATLLVLCLAASAPAATAGSWHEEQTLEHDSLLRYFRYYLPDTQPPEGYRLLFVLHGGGGDMRSFLDNGTHAEWPEIADEEGLLLVVPNGINVETGDTSGDDQHWNDCRGDAPLNDTGADDVGYISALIDWAAGAFLVDLNRVYATGSSNGGMMSYRLAFELGDRVAAIAPFIANLPAVDECRAPEQPISVFICNGDGEDNYMPWDGGCVTQKSTCERGSVISAEATREFWIEFGNLDPVPAESVDYPDLDPEDDTTAESQLYVGGHEGVELAFYTIHNGGHVTPSIEHRRSRLVLLLLGLGLQNHDIEGSREAWAFLSRQRLEGVGVGEDPGLAAMLRVRQSGSGSLELSWGGDCGSATSYGVYRGELLAGYDSIAPAEEFCSVHDTRAELPEDGTQPEFLLVVPNDGVSEGSYGSRSDGVSRAPAEEPCWPQLQLDACAER